MFGQEKKSWKGNGVKKSALEPVARAERYARGVARYRKRDIN